MRTDCSIASPFFSTPSGPVTAKATIDSGGRLLLAAAAATVIAITRPIPVTTATMSGKVR
jgi:hypothetical protein